MHETVMAQQIADVLLDVIKQHRATKLTRAVLKVGRLKQVVPDLLQFALAAALNGTPAAGAEVVIEEVPSRCRCRSCGNEFEVERWDYFCPKCNSGDVAGLTGEELFIDTVTMETDEETTNAGAHTE